MMTRSAFRMALTATLTVLAACVVAPVPGPPPAYPAYAPYAYEPYYPGYPWYFGPEIGIGVGIGQGWHGGVWMARLAPLTLSQLLTPAIALTGNRAVARVHAADGDAAYPFKRLPVSRLPTPPARLARTD